MPSKKTTKLDDAEISRRVEQGHVNPLGVLQRISSGPYQGCYYVDIAKLATLKVVKKVNHLSYPLRTLLANMCAYFDGEKITLEQIRAVANWEPNADGLRDEVFWKPLRVILQDFTGVPLLADIAMIRDAVAENGGNPEAVTLETPTTLVCDHSVQVDYAGTPDALEKNLAEEFRRNAARFRFIKWAQRSIKGLDIVPPGMGIIHQVNTEGICCIVRKVTINKVDILLPDSAFGTDSHTTMQNGIGVSGWGVGGIEAEAPMLGQLASMAIPDVVGVYLTGQVPGHVHSHDAALAITELLRDQKVTGKFVCFYGPGASNMSPLVRLAIANMAPEYGATMGFFPVDAKTADFMEMTGREKDDVRAQLEVAKKMGINLTGSHSAMQFSQKVDFNLGEIGRNVAGPKQPNQRISLPDLGRRFEEVLVEPYKSPKEGGFGVETSHTRDQATVEIDGEQVEIGHGSILIAAITSCTSTTSPNQLAAAALVAKKAVERGLSVPKWVKTSFGPGSQAVAKILRDAGLQDHLDQLGFQVAGYGCTTCIGNSGPLHDDTKTNERIEAAIDGNNLKVCSVLSGNRNFEARVHQKVSGNFLMSPPLVVMAALAGTTRINLEQDQIGVDSSGQPVYFADLWPSDREITAALSGHVSPESYTESYAKMREGTSHWQKLEAPEASAQFPWDPECEYIKRPPFLGKDRFGPTPTAVAAVCEARPLGIYGDGVTTDHISPAGAFAEDSPAGVYLLEHGVEKDDFNSYGSRRGNDRVMTRGTFANIAIQNTMVGRTGGFTICFADGKGEETTIFDAASRYAEAGTQLVVVGGEDYGTGSSRDWAAKGTNLLGVKSVMCKSFERIHRSNLVMMGIPAIVADFDELGLQGTETFSIPVGVDLTPGQDITITVHTDDGDKKVTGVLAVNGNLEMDYIRHGGILPYVVRQLLAAQGIQA